jgi:RimJ/RimL family protein N-acetyltransferase
MDFSSADAPKIRMRILTQSDSNQLLNWRNQIEIRKFSKNNRKISIDEHNIWLETRLALINELGPIFIFEKEELAIGMTRLDKKNKQESEISILVSPTNQGKGFGIKMLDLTIVHALDILRIPVLIAQIHTKNHASLALFRRFGFQIVDKRNLNSSFVMVELKTLDYRRQ